MSTRREGRKKADPKGRKPSRKELKELALLEELEGLAEKLAVEVVYDHLKTEGIVPRGGKCRVKSRHVILIEKKLRTEEKVDLLAQALSALPLDRVFVPPALEGLLSRGREASSPPDS